MLFLKNFLVLFLLIFLSFLLLLQTQVLLFLSYLRFLLFLLFLLNLPSLFQSQIPSLLSVVLREEDEGLSFSFKKLFGFFCLEIRQVLFGCFVDLRYRRKGWDGGRIKGFLLLCQDVNDRRRCLRNGKRFEQVGYSLSRFLVRTFIVNLFFSYTLIILFGF